MQSATTTVSTPSPAQLLRRSAATLSLLVAVLIAAYNVVAHLFLQRLHAAGVAQSFLSYLDGLSSLLLLPGSTIYSLLRQTGNQPGERAWLVSVLLNFGVSFAATWAVCALLPRRSRLSGPTTLPDDGLSRRSFMANGARLALGSAALAGGWSWLGEPRWFAITRRTIRLPGLAAELDGLRLLQLTDIHHGPWLSLAYVREVVEAANELRPDIVALTGDYIHRSYAYIEPVMQTLAQLKPRIGTVGVLGNHDWWEGPHLVRAGFSRFGIPLIDNTRLFVTRNRQIAREPTQGLCLAGVGDYWCDRQLYDAALANVPEYTPRILLSHNPDVAEDDDFLACGHRVDLMLSGHTHGGQVRLPLIGSPYIPSRYGQKYAAGLVQGPRCPVYISRGVGVSFLPVRWEVRPEITLIELRT